MNPDHVLELVRTERLYPGVILHGGDQEARSALAFHLAQTLLCEAEAEGRPCGRCRHCARIEAPEDSERFHPDVMVVDRDLAISTSVEAIKAMVRTVQVSPFEARGQVCIVRSADSMTPAAANSLLKSLEEPALTAPRHFLLLTPAPSDLLPTLRSRCLSVYLGPAASVEVEDREQVLADLEVALGRYEDSGATVYLMALAALLTQAVPWQDARSGAPLTATAGLLLDLAKRSDSPRRRRRLLALAHEIMEAKEVRMRSVPPVRILEARLVETMAAEC